MGRSGSAILFGKMVGVCGVKVEQDLFLSSCKSMKVSAYSKSFEPDTPLARAFGGGRGTCGELLDGDRRFVKKGWSTPRRV
jgi:hypothetical protein